MYASINFIRNYLLSKYGQIGITEVKNNTEMAICKWVAS